MSGSKIKRKKGYFSISAVAKMFSVHQQTIRLYEKEGLINPKRSDGNTRMFTEDDVEKLEEIIYLTHQLGINLAGVEMVLKLQKKIKKMQKEMNSIFDNAQDELEEETRQKTETMRSHTNDLLKLRQSSPSSLNKYSLQAPQEEESTNNDWDIDYED